MDTDAPKCVNSNTDSENTEPNRFIPITDREEPNRPNDRKASEAPRCKKSSTESEDPNRAKVRNDKDAPKCTKSKTDIDEPMRAKLLMDIEEPRCK
jgi:hypothetical protein